MKLGQLFHELAELDPGGLSDLEVMDLTCDSRQVVPGSLFVAIRGDRRDGHRFLPEAAHRGAVGAVGQQADPGLGIPYWQVPESRWTLARLAAAWNGFPARKLVMVGVTGTDGKTTTVNLITHILRHAGVKVGMISSVQAMIDGQPHATGLHVTTPGALQVQSYLSEMVNSGATHCILEATSHGLAQYRVAACDFDVAVLTNITHEHLDYHRSYESYRAAKARLFQGLKKAALKPGGLRKMAVLNADDPAYDYFRRIDHSSRQVSYGIAGDADLIGREIESTSEGIRFILAGEGLELEIEAPLLGEYNALNCLAAYGAAAEGLGFRPEVVAEGIAGLPPIPGRMEKIVLGQPYTAIVDFAHTPNGLRNALRTARQMARGRVIAVFGSAGLRDRAKRRMMGEISAELADFTILTAEDPRTESLKAILQEMARGALSKKAEENKNLWRIPDRGEALKFAVGLARAGDVVIACGKGHEQSMCFGRTEYPWDERLAMRAVIASSLGLAGPSLPRLPTSPQKAG